MRRGAVGVLLLILCVAAPAAARAEFSAHVGLGALESSSGPEPFGLAGEHGFRDSDFGYMIGGGYRFNRHLAVDLTWMRLDTGLSFDDELFEFFTMGGYALDQPLDLSGSGVRLTARVEYPLDPAAEVAAFVRGGYWHWDVEFGRSGRRTSFSGADTVFGAGLRVGDMNEMHTELNLDVHRMDGVDVDWFYLRIHFPLGQ